MIYVYGYKARLGQLLSLKKQDNCILEKNLKRSYCEEPYNLSFDAQMNLYPLYALKGVNAL